MKLNEIYPINHSHNSKRYSLTDFNVDNQSTVGYSEGGTVITKCTHKKDSRVILYKLSSKSGEYLSGVVGYNFHYKNTDYFCILDVFTSSEHRQKGHATALYTSLVKKYGIKLISDKQQTPDGIKLWNRIGKILTVKVLDVETDQFVSRQHVSDDELYNNHPERYLLVAEHNSVGINKFGVPLIGDGLLEDHLLYTHDDNVGIYE